MPGPMPQPTKLKILRGNPGQRALPANEPTPAASDAKPPKGISKDAKAIWKEIAPALINAGILTEADRSELARLCELRVEAASLRKILNDDGWVIRQNALDSHGKDAGERIKAHPAAAMLRGVESAIVALSDRFGLNPSSRSRLSIGEVGKPEDPYEAHRRRVLENQKPKAV